MDNNTYFNVSKPHAMPSATCRFTEGHCQFTEGHQRLHLWQFQINIHKQILQLKADHPPSAPFAIDQNQSLIHVAMKALIHNILAYIAIMIVITLSCDHVLIRLPKLKLQQLLLIHQAPQHDRL